MTTNFWLEVANRHRIEILDIVRRFNPEKLFNATLAYNANNPIALGAILNETLDMSPKPPVPDIVDWTLFTLLVEEYCFGVLSNGRVNSTN